MQDRTIQEIFSSDQWKSVVDAFFQATGLSVTIACVDDGCVARSSRCSLCGVTSDGFAVGEIGCVAETMLTELSGHVTRGTCRGGLPCFAALVSPDLYLTVGGFFSSTRERKRVFESLVGRGLREDQARLVVRAVPILSQHQVESYTEMIRLQADALIVQRSRSGDAEASLEGLELLVDVSREFSGDMSPEELADIILERTVRLTESVGGVLYLHRAGVLEVVAVQGDTHGESIGGNVRFGEGVAGSVAENQRTLFVHGATGVLGEDFGTRIVGLPITSDDSLRGVLCLYQSATDDPMSGGTLKRLEGVVRVGAAFLARVDKLHGTRRLAAELAQLSELSKAVGSAADIPEIEPVITSVLSKSFDNAISGLILSGWNADRAVFSIKGDVSKADVERVLLEATGRDMVQHPFGTVSWVTSDGSVHDGSPWGEEWSLLSAELCTRDKVAGFVFVAYPGAGAYTSDDRRLIEGIAQHAAVAFGKASMFERLRSDYARAIAALSVTLDAGEHATRGHSDRVMDYAMLIGREIGLPVEKVELLRFAGLLHDIGKAGISEEILLKPSRLTDDEMRRVQGHVQTGATLVEQIEFLNGLAPVIMHHHERWDGSGYPMGLRGEDIPLMARILGVADAYGAMTSERPYRKRLSYSAARAEMEAGAGTQFDPMLVAALFEALDRKILGGGTGILSPSNWDQDVLPS